jgi:leader peptidase (prepilin peptidase)/N-methyltransferase
MLAEDVTFILNGMAASFTALPISFQYGCTVLFGLVIGNLLSIAVPRIIASIEMEEEIEEQAYIVDNSTLSEKAHSILKPRSPCPSRQYSLALFENLPVLGYLLHRSRCAICRIPISFRYSALELLSAGLAGAVLCYFGASLQALAAFGLIATLLVLALIDFNTRFLPDILTLPLIWAGLLVNLNASFTPLHNAVIGAVAGYLFLWLMNWGYRLLCSKDGIGYGDFKLLAALGAWFGWIALPEILLMASATATLFILATTVSGFWKKGQSLPFGPFLAVAGILMLFSGMPLHYQ